MCKHTFVHASVCVSLIIILRQSLSAPPFICACLFGRACRRQHEVFILCHELPLLPPLAVVSIFRSICKQQQHELTIILLLPNRPLIFAATASTSGQAGNVQRTKLATKRRGCDRLLRFRHRSFKFSPLFGKCKNAPVFAVFLAYRATVS